MTDEEKKALQYFNTETTTEAMHYGAILVKLIEKQSKEIEELKDESKEYQIGFAQGCYEKDLDWEDKIKAKIEERNKWLQEYDEQEEMNELQKDDYRLIKVERTILQSLLEKE